MTTGDCAAEGGAAVQHCIKGAMEGLLKAVEALFSPGRRDRETERRRTRTKRSASVEGQRRSSDRKASILPGRNGSSIRIGRRGSAPAVMAGARPPSSQDERTETSAAGVSGIPDLRPPHTLSGRVTHTLSGRVTHHPRKSEQRALETPMLQKASQFTDAPVDTADSASTTESSDSTISICSSGHLAFLDPGSSRDSTGSAEPCAAQHTSAGGASSHESDRCTEPLGAGSSAGGGGTARVPHSKAFNTGGDSLTAFDVVGQEEDGSSNAGENHRSASSDHGCRSGDRAGSGSSGRDPHGRDGETVVVGSSSSSSARGSSAATHPHAPGAGNGGTPMPTRVAACAADDASPPSRQSCAPESASTRPAALPVQQVTRDGGSTGHARETVVAATVVARPYDALRAGGTSIGIAPTADGSPSSRMPTRVPGSSSHMTISSPSLGIPPGGLRRSGTRPVKSSPLANVQRSYSAPTHPVLRDNGLPLDEHEVRRASEPSYEAAEKATTEATDAAAALAASAQVGSPDLQQLDDNGNTAEALRLLERTRALLQEQIDTKHWHSGAMVSVVREGQPQLNLAVGEVRPGRPMTGDVMLNWMSTSKVVAVVAIGQLLERKKIGSEKDRVCKYVPEFGKYGKELITIEHLMVHTAGIPYADVSMWSKMHLWTEVRPMLPWTSRASPDPISPISFMLPWTSRSP